MEGEKTNNETWLSPEKQSVGYILWRICKNWFSWFWRLKSLMTCYPNSGKPGKVKIQQSECEDLRTGERGGINNVSPSLSSNDQKSGRPLSECRRSWISQLKQNVNSSFLHLFVLFRTSTVNNALPPWWGHYFFLRPLVQMLISETLWQRHLGIMFINYLGTA